MLETWMTHAEDWKKCDDLLRECRWAAVSFSVHYEEGADTWYCTIHSTAPSQNFVSKSGTFGDAVESALEWARGLSSNPPPWRTTPTE